MQNPSHEAKNTISGIRIQRRETMVSCPSYRAGYAAHIELGAVNREVELVEARPRYVTYTSSHKESESKWTRVMDL